MDTDFVVDKKGEVLKISSFCTYCMVIITSVLPESRPIDIVCFAKDGYIFGQLRDSDFRGSESLDNHREVVQAQLFKDKFLPPGVDRIYCHIHSDNKRAINWILSKGWIQDGTVEKEGRVVNKYYLLGSTMICNADKIKEKV